MKWHKIVTLIGFFLLWIIINKMGLIKPIFLPSLFDVWISFKTLIFSEEGVRNLFFTLKRVVIALLIAIIIAVPCGLFLGSFKKIYESLEWFIDFFRSIPVTAMFPLFLIFFGFGDISRIAMAAWASGFIILVNTLHGVWNAKDNRRIMALTKRATNIQILTKITIFEALPFIFAGIRIGISWNLIVVIVVEMFIGTSYGLGHIIYDASVMFDSPLVISGIILIGLVGYSINRLVMFVEKKIVYWE